MEMTETDRLRRATIAALREYTNAVMANAPPAVVDDLWRLVEGTLEALDSVERPQQRSGRLAGWQ